MPTSRPAAALRLPSNRSAPRLATAWLRENGPAAGLAEPALSRAEVALDELVTNVVRHGGEPPATSLAIAIESDPGELRLVVEDDGRPFDPTQAATPEFPASLDEAIEGGRGIFLARSFADRMRYERVGDRNRVTLAFLVASPAEPC